MLATSELGETERSSKALYKPENREIPKLSLNIAGKWNAGQYENDS